MKKISLGLAVALLSGVAYAQTSQAPTAGSAATGSAAPQTSAGPSSGTSTGASGAPRPMMRSQTGGQGQTEVTGSTESRSVGIRSTESGRTRVEGGTRVGVGVGVTTREEGVSVRHRTVHEVEEPSVSVTRRRSVTTVEEPSTEVHRTVIKKAKPATKKVAVHKKKPTRVVVHSRRKVVVDEPVEIRRSRTVHRYEVDEPSVSVSRRSTTVHRSQDVGASVGVSVEQRRSSVRSSGEMRPSGDVNVTTSRQGSSAPETTGAVSTRSQTNATGASGGAPAAGSSSGSGGSAPARLQPGGSPSGGSAGQNGSAKP